MNFVKAAEKCADLIWKKGILRKGPGICHGVAGEEVFCSLQFFINILGNGYAFLLLYKFTGNEAFLEKAKAFARVMMSPSLEVNNTK